MYGELARLIQAGKARLRLVTSAPVALGNNADGYTEIECPKYKFWFLLGGDIYNGDDVGRTAYIAIRDKENRDAPRRLIQAACGAAGWLAYPDHSWVFVGIPHLTTMPFMLDEGWDLYCFYNAGGVSAGGDSWFTAVVLEVDKQ